MKIFSKILNNLSNFAGNFSFIVIFLIFFIIEEKCFVKKDYMKQDSYNKSKRFYKIYLKNKNFQFLYTLHDLGFEVLNQWSS